MNILTRAGLVAFALLSFAFGQIQYSDAAVSDGDQQMLAQWHGHWRGELQNIPPQDDAPVVSVSLDIGVGDNDGDGCLVWRSTYSVSDDVRQVKDYQFCRSAGGRYYVDEGEGVRLDSSVFESTIYSMFKSGNTLLITRYNISGDQMVEEIFFAPSDGRAIGEVTTFMGGGLQRITFSRSPASSD